MNEKIKLAVLFGGQSGEHEVSLVSATSIIKNIDCQKYDMYLIGITKDGKWLLFEGNIDKIATGKWEQEAQPIVFPGDPSFGGFFLISNPNRIHHVDVVFPVMHGPHGEDGTIQGLLELANIPYVGCDVVASAAGMDKAISKYIFESKNLPQAKYMIILKRDFENNKNDILTEIEKAFPYPVFVKPANMGSSVGISKAYDRDSLKKAICLASKYDRKIIIEEFINGHEIECAVLGNNNPQVSVPGRIVPSNDFYDYTAKYNDEGKSRLIIPADIDKDTVNEIHNIAIKAYKALDCSGLARIDFFVHKETNKVYLNEVNTMPGFTNISMYPKLFQESGIPYEKLIDNLIDLAIDRFKEKHNIE